MRGERLEGRREASQRQKMRGERLEERREASQRQKMRGKRENDVPHRALGDPAEAKDARQEARACYVLSSIKVMNRFSHVDLAAPPFPPACGGGQGGRAQIMDERCNDPGLQPALGLLRDGVPRRRSVGHHAPGRSRAMR